MIWKVGLQKWGTVKKWQGKKYYLRVWSYPREELLEKDQGKREQKLILGMFQYGVLEHVNKILKNLLVLLMPDKASFC